MSEGPRIQNGESRIGRRRCSVPWKGMPSREGGQIQADSQATGRMEFERLAACFVPRAQLPPAAAQPPEVLQIKALREQREPAGACAPRLGASRLFKVISVDSTRVGCQMGGVSWAFSRWAVIAPQFRPLVWRGGATDLSRLSLEHRRRLQSASLAWPRTCNDGRKIPASAPPRHFLEGIAP